MSHRSVREDECTALCKAKSKLESPLNTFDKNRFMNSASGMLKVHLSTALASAPALPVSMAAVVFPLAVGGFLQHHQLIKEETTPRFVKSFPSETYLRMMMHDQAARCSLSLGRKLAGKQAFLACDKGNKKGVGHFVKCACWWSGTKVEIELVDCDASGGTNEQCARAMQKSFYELKMPFAFKLCGQGTDSGGGGVSDGLAKELKLLKLCAKDYLAGPCGTHCFQLQLSRPTKELMGEGGLDKQNAVQLLHSICDLQESLEWPECEEALNVAQDLTNQCLLNGGMDESVGSEADKSFARKFNLLMTFWNFQPHHPPSLEGKKKRSNGTSVRLVH